MGVAGASPARAAGDDSAGPEEMDDAGADSDGRRRRGGGGGSSSGGGDGEVYEKTSYGHAEKALVKFQTQVAACPAQCIRYVRWT